MKIESNRLILRNLEYSDIDDIVEGLNDIEVSKWLAGAPYPYTKKDAKEFIIKAKNTKENYNFAIELKENKKVIGVTQLTVKDKENKIYGGGIWLNRKYHGKGYGIEAFNSRIKFAFNTIGAKEIENGFFEGNISSKRMQEKLGYKIVGIRKEHFISKATGKVEDEIVTRLIKEDWKNIN